jgi:hypothetical protein
MVAMTTGELSLDYVSRRLDDIQREMQHHRPVADMLVKQFMSLYAEFDAQRASPRHRQPA